MSNPVELSTIQLSQILNSIIGTQNIIKSRRIAVNKLTRSHKWFTLYIIGSRCDGFSLKGVDVDYMLVHKHLPVIDTYCSDESCKTPPPNYLLACCSPSSTAYMCLEIHIQVRDMLNTRLSVIGNLCHSVIYYRDSLLVSSSLFLQNNSRVDGGDVVGPSQINLHNMLIDNDNVQAFHCKTFPLMAH